MKLSFRSAIIWGAATALVLLIINLFRFQPRIVVCDVGQGEAIYLRLPEQKDLLIDFGTNTSGLKCLNGQLPFFDRQIEAAFLTHLDSDHSGGLLKVLDTYTITTLYVPASLKKSTNQYFLSLTKRLAQQGGSLQYLQSGDQLISPSTIIRVLWPKEEFNYQKLTSNQSALVLLIKINLYQALFLSDLEIAQTEQILNSASWDKLNLLKMSHHGSKYGTSSQMLEILKPKLAIISVGKNNRYGHPDKYVLSLLKKYHTPVRRTDIEGEITININ